MPITPLSASIPPSGTQTFTSTLAGARYRLGVGVLGTINPTTGLYTADATAITADIVYTNGIEAFNNYYRQIPPEMTLNADGQSVTDVTPTWGGELITSGRINAVGDFVEITMLSAFSTCGVRQFGGATPVIFNTAGDTITDNFVAFVTGGINNGSAGDVIRFEKVAGNFIAVSRRTSAQTTFTLLGTSPNAQTQPLEAYLTNAGNAVANAQTQIRVSGTGITNLNLERASVTIVAPTVTAQFIVQDTVTKEHRVATSAETAGLGNPTTPVTPETPQIFRRTTDDTTQPTATEYLNPVTGNVAQIVLPNGSLVFWTFGATAWGNQQIIAPTLGETTEIL